METSTGTRFGTLQSFQQQLAQRLQHAQLSPGNTQAYLACATSMQRWLFDLAHAEAILSGEQPTKVPFTRHWYLGLISHRGQLIGVIDLDGFAGAEPRPWQRGDRLLVLSSVLPLRCAIRVTHMIGVIDQAHLCRADPTTNSPSWAAHSFTHHDGSHYLGVDLAALMATPSFLDIAQYQA